MKNVIEYHIGNRECQHDSGLGIIEEIGVGLALGVLIDTFVSWMFFVPAIMTVMDKYNWWPSKIVKDSTEK